MSGKKTGRKKNLRFISFFLPSFSCAVKPSRFVAGHQVKLFIEEGEGGSGKINRWKKKLAGIGKSPLREERKEGGGKANRTEGNICRNRFVQLFFPPFPLHLLQRRVGWSRVRFMPLFGTIFQFPAVIISMLLPFPLLLLGP